MAEAFLAKQNCYAENVRAAREGNPVALRN